MTRIVLVHGRAQQGRDADAIRREWTAALRLGLADRASLLDGVTVDVPFYGDRLDQLLQELGSTLPEDLLARGTTAGADEEFLRFQVEVFNAVREAEGVSTAQIQAEMDGIGQRGPLNWFWVRAIMKALNRVEGLDAIMIEQFTRDVWFYLTRSAIRTEVNEIVGEHIFRSGRTIVVAHSLGSVVAYDLLRDAAGLDVSLFLTVGSPLGIGAIRKRVKPVVHPKVKRWFNARDERDVVAMHPLIGEYFACHPQPVDHSAVRNRSANAHHITGYLNDAKTSAQIAMALTEA